MKISMEMILDKMHIESSVCIQNFQGKKCSISHVSIWDEKIRSTRSDTLYIVEYDNRFEYRYEKLPNVLFIGDEISPVDFRKYSHSNAVAIQGNYDIYDILDRAQNAIAFYNNMDNCVMEILKQNKGIQNLVDALFKFVGNPISICDTNLKMLAYTKFSDTKDDQWENIYQTTVQEEYLSNGNIRYLEQFCRISKPTYFERESPSRAYFAMNLAINGEIVGLMGVHDTEKEFTPGTCDLVNYIGEMLSLELQKNQVILQNKDVKNGYLLHSLLEDNDIPQTKKNEIETYLDVKKNDYLFVLAFTKQIEADNSYEFSHVHLNIAKIINRSICLNYKKNIVVLMASNSTSFLNESLQYKLESFLSDNNIYAGISRPFQELKNVEQRYSDAITALEVGKKVSPDQHIFQYLDFQFEDLLEICTKSEEISRVFHPALHTLMEYDSINQADLADTLYAYLKYGKSQTETAKRLNLHRSSLQYRLKKIEEVLEISLDDYHSLLHIQICFEMQKYLNISVPI